MKNLSFLMLSIFLNFSAFSQHGVVKSAGAIREMGKTGFALTISMHSLQQYPRIFGMGPLGKMQGEIRKITNFRGIDRCRFFQITLHKFG